MPRQVAVGADLEQLAPRGQPGQLVAQILAGGTLDLIGMRDDAVQRAVFGQPLGGGLGAHLVHAGHVVDGVAHEGLVVQHLRRAHAELGLHAGQVASLAAHGVDDANVLGDELRQVLVAAGDDDLQALLRTHAGQRADHVVGLHAGHGQHAPAQQLDHLVDRRDLAAQIVGHGRAVGLVLGVDRVAKSGPRGVEHAGGVGRVRVVLL